MKEHRNFKNCGNWYKGNTHSHTTVSDGMFTSGQSIMLYRDNGYHFMCSSGHDISMDFREQFSTETFIILPATKSSVIPYRVKGMNERYRVHHLHGVLGTQAMQDAASPGTYRHMQHIPPMKFLGRWTGAQVAQKTVDMLRNHGCVTTHNHPIWSRAMEEKFIHAEDISTLEIFNYGTVQESNIGYNVTYWGRMLHMGRCVNAFASDDNHNEGLFEDPYEGWIHVRVPDLNYDSIVQNFMEGNYYSPPGPEIHNWDAKDGRVWIDTSGVNHVNFVCGNIINNGTAILGERFKDTLSYSEYTPKGHKTYMRVEAVGRYDRTAWTNSIYLEWQMLTLLESSRHPSLQ